MSILNRIAAVDVGSNGIRLAIAEPSDTSDFPFTIIDTRRAAVRLGADSFHLGYLTETTIDKVVEALREFHLNMDEMKVKQYRAVATSAVRDCANNQALINEVRKRAGVKIEIIGGLEEAQLMYHAIATKYPLKNESAILIDMGGGSVELTVVEEGHASGAETLPLGPVRLLSQLDLHSLSELKTTQLINPQATAIRTFIKTEIADPESPVISYACGGNIEALGKLRIPILGKSKSYKIKLNDLQTITPVLLAMSVQERIDEFNLRPDRADVIAIAAVVLQMIMEQANLKRILIPGLGIKDGILLQMTSKHFP